MPSNAKAIFNGTVKQIERSPHCPVEAANHRGDLFNKRRKLMDAWAIYRATPRRVLPAFPLIVVFLTVPNRAKELVVK
jgi:hypothetical protein